MKSNYLKQLKQYCIVLITVIGGSIFHKINAQDSALLVPELERINYQLTLMEQTSMANKLGNLASKENLEILKKGAEGLKKVSNYIKTGKEVEDAYQTEQRILTKVSRLGNNINNEMDNGLITETQTILLDRTGVIIDQLTQLVTDNLFSMTDKERLDYIDALHQKLLTIESIIDGKYAEQEVNNQRYENFRREEDMANEYYQELMEQRARINQQN